MATASSMNLIEPIVASYRGMLSKKAEYILSTSIPEQLDLLQDILKDPKIDIRYQEEVRNHSIATISEYERVLEQINEANQAKQVEMEQALKMLFGGGMTGKGSEEKEGEECEAGSTSKLSTKDSKIILGKRKRKSDSATSLTLGAKGSNVSIELKLSENGGDAENATPPVEELEPPVIGINQKINDLAQMLKPVILNLYDTCVLLRNWIVLLIPKVEDGNNFGVEVQENCLQGLKIIEVEMLNLFEYQAAYHLERATIISKIGSASEILDYKQYIYDSDERQCRKLQETAYSLRSNYNTLYRTITQNYDKITAPRGFTNNHLQLY
jgi:hypothetical protein